MVSPATGRQDSGSNPLEPPRSLRRTIENITGAVTALIALLAVLGTFIDKVQVFIPWLTPERRPLLLVLAILLFVASMYVYRKRALLRPEIIKPSALQLKVGEHVEGRQEDIDKVVTALTDNPLVWLTGESGSGKSTLLKGGVANALRLDPARLVIYMDAWGADWILGPQEALLDAARRALKEAKLDTNDPVDASQLFEELAKMRAETGRLPIILFDQFDDYQIRHRAQFVDNSGLLISQEVLSQRNSFWTEIAKLLRQGSIHCLFVARADSVDSLSSVRFLEPAIYPLARLRAGYALPLLQRLTAGDVIAHPEAGWQQLIRQVCADMESDSTLLPIEMKVVFLSLVSLRPLTISSYRQQGGLKGLEAAHISICIAETARHAGVDPTDVRRLLLKMVDRPSNRTVPVTEEQLLGTLSASERQQAKLERILQNLVNKDLVRKRIDPDTRSSVWLLDHDYLCRGILELDRRSTVWQHVLNDADASFRAAQGHWEKWKTLLNPWVQTRLAWERLRGHVTYGNSRRLAMLSLLKIVINLPIVLLVGLYFWEGPHSQHARLEDWLLPPDLYERQSQLTSLRIHGYSITELGWLKHTNLHKLDIEAARLTSVAGIRNPRSIQALSLDLAGRPVDSLADIGRVPGLETLCLSLGNSKVSDLAPLAQAGKLTSLSLDLGGSLINDINELGNVTKLQHLTLRLAGSKVGDLKPVVRLKELQSLKLDLDPSQLAMMADLDGAGQLSDLTLWIGNLQDSAKPDALLNIPSLAGLTGLKHFTLILKKPADSHNPKANLYRVPIKNLDALVLPGQLETLDINVESHAVTGLPPITHLANLQHLGLHLHETGLQNLPGWSGLTNLRSLDLALDAPQASALRKTKLTDLEYLRLELRGADVKDLPPLSSLTALRTFKLEVWQTSITAFRDLPALKGLTNLELHLDWNQAEKLPSLTSLKQLDTLSIYLDGSAVHDLPALGIRRELANLTLSLNGTPLSRLPDLRQFSGLQKLAVYVGSSEIQSLESIAALGTLKSLVLDLHDARIQQFPNPDQLRELSDLSLVLDGTGVRSLPDLTALQGFRDATVDIRNSRPAILAELNHLAALHEIRFDQTCDSLKDLPPTVDRIAFNWRP